MVKTDLKKRYKVQQVPTQRSLIQVKTLYKEMLVERLQNMAEICFE